MPRKSLSVLLPTCDAAEYLVQTIESILKQTRLPDEIIFCDDVSTDNTFEILQDYALRYKGLVRLMRNNERLGLAGNRQKLLESTSCDIVKYFDDDDILLPSFLELMTPLVESGEFDVAACSVLNFDNHDVTNISGDFPVRLREWDEPRWAYHIAVAGHLINKIHDRKFLTEAGGFIGLYGPAVDFYLDLRLMKKNARLGVLAEHLILHRRRDRSRTFTYDELMVNAFRFLWDTVSEIESEGYFEGHPKQRKILADRLWHMGRLLSDSGQFDLAMEAFAASRKLLNQGIVYGGFFYKIVATFLGIGAAEKMRCQLSKIKNKAR